MDDREIIEKLFNRQQTVLDAINTKYRNYLFVIGNHILHDVQDCEEALNDTYLAAWNTIPPQTPNILSVYLSRIMRRISIDILRKRTSQKRIPDNIKLCIDELEECVSTNRKPDEEFEAKELAHYISIFLRNQSEERRMIFMLRYYYTFSIKEICAKTGFSDAKVKNILLRQRKELKAFLEKGGVF